MRGVIASKTLDYLLICSYLMCKRACLDDHVARTSNGGLYPLRQFFEAGGLAPMVAGDT